MPRPIAELSAVGELDVVGLARPLCVDPDVPQKLLEGSLDKAPLSTTAASATCSISRLSARRAHQTPGWKKKTALSSRAPKSSQGSR